MSTPHDRGSAANRTGGWLLTIGAVLLVGSLVLAIVILADKVGDLADRNEALTRKEVRSLLTDVLDNLDAEDRQRIRRETRQRDRDETRQPEPAPQPTGGSSSPQPADDPPRRERPDPPQRDPKPRDPPTETEPPAPTEQPCIAELLRPVCNRLP